MKKKAKVFAIGGVIAAIVIVVVIGFVIACTTRISNGYEGIIYSINGGVQNETVGPGWHFIGPGKRISQFTIANEQIVLTKDSRDGSKDDESFSVATADNASLPISFQMTYRFDPDRIVEIYKSFKLNGEDIVNNRVKTVLKARISEVTTEYTIMDIYSGNLSELNTKITEYLNEKFKPIYGIEVIDASIIGSHPEKKLQQAIDDRIEAQQNADKAKVEQEKVKIEAETKMIQAQNEADIKKVNAQAEADANKLLSESITDELIRMKEAEARLQHGWVTVQGADTVVTDKK